MRTFCFFLLASASCFFSCNHKPAPQKMTGLAGAMQDSILIRISPRDIDTLKMSDPNIPVIDVRSESEFRIGHLFRSMNCDVDAPDFAQRIVKLGLERPVVLYDDNSTRSLHAAEKMLQLGFKRVYELAGGMYSLARDGKTFVTGDSKIDSSTILR